MNRILSGSGLALGALTTIAMSIAPAHAVVYCRAVGIPQGCVVRPVAPVARAVARNNVGAPGVGVRSDTTMNRGGPVNRVGRR